MATLTAWKFNDPDKAQESVGVLEDLDKAELIKLIDAAWVTWPPDKRAPKTHQLHHSTAVAAIGGGFLGLLLGLIFFIPLLGLAVGAAGGTAVFKLQDVGIDEEFIDKVRREVTPGSSALFALTEGAVEDPVVQAFSRFEPQLITSNLSAEQEENLRETFLAD